MKSAYIGIIGLVLGTATPALAEIKIGDRAADFEKQGTLGQTVKMSAMQGKVVLVDFWASWCEPCKKELPILGKIAPRLRARGIEIVTINVDESKSNAMEFIRAHQLQQLTTVLDSDKSLVGKYEPPSMPTSFVVDKSGIVRALNAGFEVGDEAKIEKQLANLANK